MLSTARASSPQIIHPVIHLFASKLVDNRVADRRPNQVNFRCMNITSLMYHNYHIAS